jgi:release factor glutamine methyltransferase
VSTYGAVLAAARGSLTRAGIASAGLDARLLLSAVTELSLSTLIARDRDPLPPIARSRFDAHLKRRLEGEPVARILGQKEFWGLPFELSAATLVPRPETEILVEHALPEARRHPPGNCRICDLGTGSGAILIALLTELPNARGVGTDISEQALIVARRNAERHGVLARADFVKADFSAGPDGPFDVVVSNPPYIRSSAIPGLDPAVRDYDPRAALDGGADGLEAYRAILDRADSLLSAGGFLAFEVGYGQGESVVRLCRDEGFSEVVLAHDLAGIGRVVTGRWIGSGQGRQAKKPLGNGR